MSQTTTIVLLLLFVVPVLSPAVNTIAGSVSNKNFTNETILTAPTDAVLARAVANGINLADYTKVKDTDFVIPNGNWTLKLLHEKFPVVVEQLSSPDNGGTDKGNEFLIRKTIVIDRGAQLDIVNNNVFLESSSNKDNIPISILTYGKMSILNSTVTSWDPQAKAADPNPYHPRPFIVAKDEGKMDIIKSTITNMGFSQGGIHSLFSSLAAINYYNTSNFIIANSTIANNLYGIYSYETSDFKIVGNDIHDHISYGIDPQRSRDFVIDSNHIRFSGLQGFICSYQCENITITNNLVEYNTEGIGLHWLTNSSLIKNNIVKYNKNYGIFIKNNSGNNVIEKNVIMGNGYGVGLINSSNNNTIMYNSIIGNILSQEAIRMDKTSRLNLAMDNTLSR